MAKFQIKMLTPLIKDDISHCYFLETPISDFESQSSSDLFLKNSDGELPSKSLWTVNTFSYTFDEKISFHKHGQKELSFSMLKNI
jgi:hypothetical protein